MSELNTETNDNTTECDVEDGVTMLDVLQDEQSLEKDAAAVLGNVSDTACTYTLGYMTRQPVYACKTCQEDDQPSGVCLACSYDCHEGHNLVELYTKRLFRCDCGTNKLKSSCKLVPSKEENIENKYNQNFSGLYCICRRPYPDPDDPVEDCMIQCVMCEDWYHGRHTGMGEAGPPDDSLYDEMICGGCVSITPFLQHYTGLVVSKLEKEKDDIDVCVEQKVSSEKTNNISEGDTTVEPKAKDEAVNCYLSKPLPSNYPFTGSLFLPMVWRSTLCKCSSCMQMYLDTKITYLTTETDTVHHYESQAVERKDSLEQGMEALSQLDRVKQVEAIHSYNNMKENLMEYLSKFSENKKVVREEDIKTFFEGMKSNKKQKIGGGPPPSCK